MSGMKPPQEIWLQWHVWDEDSGYTWCDELVNEDDVKYVLAPIGAADALELALIFHEIYERLAPQFGYETRPETREFDPESPNGELMIAVCEQLLAWRGRDPDTVGHLP